MGNRTRLIVDGEVFDATHDANDRLLSFGTETSEWDARGRLVSRDAGAGVGPVEYAWSQDDRLLSVAGPLPGPVDDVVLAYDPEQRLVARTESSSGTPVTTRLVVDPSFPHAQVLLEYVGSPSPGAVTARHAFGHRLLGEEQGGTLRWALTDALGSVRGLYEPGAPTPLIGPWTYEGFGPELGEAPATPLTHRFAGERRDAATGLDYLRARWMRPEWGGFVSRDPWEGDVRWPVMRSPNLYGHGEPTRIVDPSGLFGLADTQIAASIQSMLVEVQAGVGLSVLDQVSQNGNVALENLITGAAIAGGAAVVATVAWRFLARLARRGSVGDRFAAAVHFRSLGLDSATGKFRLNEAVGASRLERHLGRQIQRATKERGRRIIGEGADFIDGGRLRSIDLKGPLLDATGAMVPKSLRDPIGLADSAKRALQHSGADSVVVDLLGLDADEIRAIKAALPDVPTNKTLLYLD